MEEKLEYLTLSTYEKLYILLFNNSKQYYIIYIDIIT